MDRNIEEINIAEQVHADRVHPSFHPFGAKRSAGRSREVKGDGRSPYSGRPLQP